MQIEILNKSTNLNPRYVYKGDAGMDLAADFSKVSVENPIKTKGDCQFVFPTENVPGYLVLDSMSRALIPTNIHIGLPYGYEAQIRPRSGLSFKEGLMAIFGTIDHQYTGNLFISVINLSKDPVVIEQGERIAQLVVKKVEEVEWVNVNILNETARGENGFNSTGKK